jgi:hypothetical protein
VVILHKDPGGQRVAAGAPTEGPGAPAGWLKLIALAPLVVGALAWIVLADTTDEPWSEALEFAGVWAAVAFVAWCSPILGALLLVVGAVLGALFALIMFFVESLLALGNPHSKVGPWLFWLLFGWWAVLPLVAAVLFVAIHGKRTGRDPIW